MTVQTNNLSEQTIAYLWQLGGAEPDILKQLRQQTATHRMAKMSLAPAQVQFMCWLLKLINATHYLELGVFTGYSSTAAALTLPEQGTVTACDINITFTDIARTYWEKANVAHKIQLHLQPALITMQELVDEGKTDYFDFILIDADKPSTPQYYEAALKLLRLGGLIMIDNILLGGRVPNVQKNEETSNSILVMEQFNAQLQLDKRITPIALPMGDGTLLIRKEAVL